MLRERPARLTIPSTRPTLLRVRIDVLTIFPEMFTPDAPGVLGVSIPARARKAGVVEWHATDVRAFAGNKHAKTDDRPFGGGPGMVMSCQPLWDAVQHVEALDPRPATRVLLTPQGRPLTQELVEELASKPRLLLIAGHYEGIDERVVERLAPLEVSIGDYVLSGGELGAVVLMDAVIRLLPGALGDEASAMEDSFGVNEVAPALLTPDGRKPPKGAPARRLRLLDCPHYTRPREWMGMSAPDVLFSGDHAAVARWRMEQRLARTRARRPDLLPPELREPPAPTAGA